MSNKQQDQLLGVFILIIAGIITFVTRSGGEIYTQSYVEKQRDGISQVGENQFCLEFANSVSGTVEYKNSIYQDCKGD